MNDNPILELQDLVKEFAGVRVIDGVSLAVKPGEVVFLVGPSGAGKSTVLRCMNFLEQPDAGQVLFHGQAVPRTEKALNAYRSRVGMVFQHFNLFPHLNIVQNITLAPVTSMPTFTPPPVSSLALAAPSAASSLPRLKPAC